jgi:hypothetical protein
MYFILSSISHPVPIVKIYLSFNSDVFGFTFSVFPHLYKTFRLYSSHLISIVNKNENIAITIEPITIPNSKPLA